MDKLTKAIVYIFLGLGGIILIYFGLFMAYSGLFMGLVYKDPHPELTRIYSFVFLYLSPLVVLSGISLLFFRRWSRIIGLIFYTGILSFCIWVFAQDILDGFDKEDVGGLLPIFIPSFFVYLLIRSKEYFKKD